MSSADVVLSYIKVLVWPAVAIAAVWLFRSQIRTLILHARRVTAFGAEAEFNDLEKRVDKTERQLDPSAESGVAASPTGGAVVASGQEIVNLLGSVDLDDIDSLDPISAAVQVTHRLDVKVSEVMGYFGVPAKVIDVVSAGALMTKITQVEQWQEFLALADELKRAATVLSAYQDTPTWLHVVSDPNSQVSTERTLEAAKRVTGAAYRLSKALPELVQRSLISRLSRAQSGLLSVAVYVDGDADAMTEVLARVDQLIGTLGYDKPFEDVLEKGSLFRRYWTMPRRDSDVSENSEKLAQAMQALELRSLTERQSQVDQNIAESVLRLVESLANVSDASVRIGSILLLKYTGPEGPIVIARNLSAKEIQALDSNPGLLRDPREVLDQLGTLDLESDLPPAIET